MISKRLYAFFFIFGSLAALGCLIFARGGYFRIYWLPASFILVSLAALFALLANHGIIKFKLHPITDLSLLALLIWAAVSYVSSINRERTAFELLRFTTILAFYFISAYALNAEFDKKIFAFALILMGFVEAVYGLAEFFTGKALIEPTLVQLPHSIQRVTGTFGVPNHYAAFMYICIFLSLGIINAVRHSRKPSSERFSQVALLAIPCAVMALALILSLSRGGWAAFICGLIFFLALFFIQKSASLSKVFLYSLIVGLLVGAFIMALNRKPLLKRLESLEQIYQDPDELSTTKRISLWNSSMAIIKDHPLHGVGWGAYESAYPGYRRDFLVGSGQFAHNTYLNIASEIGIPGLVVFLIFLAAVYFNGLKAMLSKKREFWVLAMPGVLAAIFALAVHDLVEFNFSMPANTMLFFFLSAVAVTAENDN